MDGITGREGLAPGRSFLKASDNMQATKCGITGKNLDIGMGCRTMEERIFC
jgi:hypothetical protein